MRALKNNLKLNHSNNGFDVQGSEWFLWLFKFRGAGHHKMRILSLFLHPHVTSNLCECISSSAHKRRYFEESLKPIEIHDMKTKPFLFFLCVLLEKNSNRFTTTWGGMNDSRLTFWNLQTAGMQEQVSEEYVTQQAAYLDLQPLL